MKNIFLFTALLVGTLSTRAADLLVDINGQGGAYSSIASACAAAASGDRLVINPGIALDRFNENPIVPTGVTLVSAVQGTKYKITGNVILSGNASMYGADVTGFVNIATGRVAGCKVSLGISQSATTGECFIENDTVTAGGINIYRGRVTGNYVIGGTGNSQTLYLQNSGVATNDTVFIVGNTFIDNYNGTTVPGIILNTVSQYFYVANNRFTFNASNAHTHHIEFTQYKTSTTVRNVFINNLIENTTVNSFTSGYTVAVPFATGFTGIIANNVFRKAAGNTNAGFNFTTAPNTANFLFAYNYNSGSGALALGYTADATNVVSSAMTFNANGSPATGAIINGGSPDASMLDLDLTRNDAGCFGGSYSMANFFDTPANDAKARVLFVKVPRTGYSTVPININADGLDK